MSNVIKRNGSEVEFDIEKIVNAISKANEEVENKLTPSEITELANKVQNKFKKLARAVSTLASACCNENSALRKLANAFSISGLLPTPEFKRSFADS